MNEFKLLLDKFNKEHKHIVDIRAILKNLDNDRLDTTGMTAQEIIKEIRKRQQE